MHSRRILLTPRASFGEGRPASLQVHEAQQALEVALNKLDSVSRTYVDAQAMPSSSLSGTWSNESATAQREQQLWDRQMALWDRELQRWDQERRAWDEERRHWAAREAALLDTIRQLHARVPQSGDQQPQQLDQAWGSSPSSQHGFNEARLSSGGQHAADSGASQAPAQQPTGLDAPSSKQGPTEAVHAKQARQQPALEAQLAAAFAAVNSTDVLENDAGPPPSLMQGADDIFWVSQLHAALLERGFFPGEEEMEDWVFGSQTHSALLTFQACEGLPETGFVDKRTWEALLGEDLRPLRLTAAKAQQLSDVTEAEAGKPATSATVSEPPWADLFATASEAVHSPTASGSASTREGNAVRQLDDWPVLCEGEGGELVHHLQAALSRHGYHCGDDEMQWWQFGPRTMSALQMFQASLDLPESGVADENSWRALVGPQAQPSDIYSIESGTEMDDDMLAPHEGAVWLLKFPADRLLPRGSSQSPEGFGLASNLGPFGLGSYQTQTRLTGAAEPLSEHALAPVSLMIGCKVCHNLAANAFETAKSWVHAEGTAPPEDRVQRLLRHVCSTQLPPVLLRDWVIEQQRVEKLDVAGVSMDFGADGAPVFILKQRGDEEISHYETQAVQYACSRLLEEGASGRVELVNALMDALELYAAKLQALRGSAVQAPGVGAPSLASRPDGTTCKDFHIQCNEWAAQGECEKNPRYMVGDEDQVKFRGHCRLACGVSLQATDSATEDIIKPKPDASPAPIAMASAGASGGGSGAAEGMAETRVAVVRKALAAMTGPVKGEPPALPADASEIELSLAKDLGNLCLYLSSGWWTYEVCYMRHVRQFRLEAGHLVTAVNNLGEFDPDATAEMLKAAEQRGQNLGLEKADLLTGARLGALVVPQAYTLGGDCEVRIPQTEGGGTRLVKRETEVRLACSPLPGPHMIIREPSKCRYVIALYVPSLCRFDDFRGSRPAFSRARQKGEAAIE
ncbi:hypothetical protein WJX72_006548 [[Myrmecia] bisecta]|uniref:MRH domain-containing protein n=1 Tax=[Myrmecia] bisecta TaxID=41462 RepID=A0AAW1Q396_9CHLO